MTPHSCRVHTDLLAIKGQEARKHPRSPIRVWGFFWLPCACGLSGSQRRPGPPGHKHRIRLAVALFVQVAWARAELSTSAGRPCRWDKITCPCQPLLPSQEEFVLLGSTTRPCHQSAFRAPTSSPENSSFLQFGTLAAMKAQSGKCVGHGGHHSGEHRPQRLREGTQAGRHGACF